MINRVAAEPPAGSAEVVTGVGESTGEVSKPIDQRASAGESAVEDPAPLQALSSVQMSIMMKAMETSEVRELAKQILELNDPRYAVECGPVCGLFFPVANQHHGLTGRFDLIVARVSDGALLAVEVSGKSLSEIVEKLDHLLMQSFEREPGAAVNTLT